MYGTIQYNSLSTSTGYKQAMVITGLNGLLQLYKPSSNKFYMKSSVLRSAFTHSRSIMFLNANRHPHRGALSQPPVSILHILSKAVERRLLTLGLKDMVPLPRGLFSGP